MRFITMLIGLALMVLAGLWFFTPVLDSTYAKHAPRYADPRKSVAAAPSGGVTRGAAPEAARPAPRAAAPASGGGSGGGISTKALAENVMSMVNLGAGLVGAWFTYLSYRMQVRARRRRDEDA